jgi:hypothetical protein
MPLVQTTTVTGLQEFDFIVPTTDAYTIQGTLEVPFVVPTAAQGPGGGGIGTGSTPGLPTPSQIVTVVKQNSTTKYTSNPGDKGFLTGINATAGDTIKVIFSSSQIQDEQLNAMKCTIAISEGEAL